MRTKILTESADKPAMRLCLRSGRDGRSKWLQLFTVLVVAAAQAASGIAQTAAVETTAANDSGEIGSAGLRISVPLASSANRFVHSRAQSTGVAGAAALAKARAEHAAMVQAQAVHPRLATLSAAWTPVGPARIASLAYGKISGRVSSIAIDAADPTGNTVYIGTTGGGVWKSTNAAGPVDSVVFQPLTDNLPVFTGNATASISIGAISVQSGIVLAGTGDPNDASDSYYGSGILRSTDGGLTWTLAQFSQDGSSGQHSFLGLGFAGFAWSTANSSLVVAAVSQSAEGAIVNAPAKTSVMGLYVSSDAGSTWQLATIADGTTTIQTPLPVGANQGGIAATSVAWNPIRQRFYAAIRYHGYYESQNGLSWTRLPNQPGTALTARNCPAAPGTSGSISCPVFRGAIAVQPVTGDMFALTTDRNNIDQGLWQDVCGISAGNCTSNTVGFANRIASTALEAGSSATIPQADYHLGLAAASTPNDTLLFVGTGDLYRCSLAGGCLLRNTTNATNACSAPARVAPSQHAIAVLPSSSLLFLGNDSGLWRSTDDINEQGAPCSNDDASHFDNLNGGIGSLAEVISFAQDPTDSTILLAGLGASGTVSSSAAGSDAWQQISSGEGGTVAIDPINPLLWYISAAGGVSIAECASGKNCTAADFAGPPTIAAVQTSADASLLDPPWVLDPVLSANVIVGTCRIWRGPAASGASWPGGNQLSTTLGGPPNVRCDPATNPFVHSIAAAGPAVSAGTVQNSGSRTLYAGMAGSLDGGGVFAGHVFSTSKADTASSTTRWADLAQSPVTNDASNSGRFNPGGFDISSLSADSHDATGATVYATVLGFSGNGISAPHVYGSTDGGAHWTNLSSNLPNAPANSIVVDPNDANTLYVALDTGVYVTTQISSCSTANCWTPYGISLPNSPVVQLSAAGRMATVDSRVGMLRAATYGRGVWQIPLLTASTAAKASISLSPSELSFSGEAVGTLSAAQTMLVTNTGNAPLVISRSTTTGDFNSIDTCTGSTVAVNASCSIQVQFLPSAQGLRTGILTVYANIAGGQAIATLSGNGTAPGAIVLTPLALSFASTALSATSAPQNVTIANVGGDSAALPSPSTTGDFQISANTCSSSLAPGTGCTVSVVFHPSAAGQRTGSLQVAGSAGTLTASLTGTAFGPATDSLSAGSLSFSAQQLGTASSAQQLTLTNAGDVALTLIATQIASGDFTAVNGCGNSLNAHSSCSIGVSFAPTIVGATSGTLVISDQFRSQMISLNGMGVAPPGVSLSPSGSISFPATPVGMQSMALAVTLTNNGGLPLLIQSVSLTGDFVLVAGGSCGASVAPSAACTLQLTFAPSVGGQRSGALVISDSAPASPQTLSLNGTGIDFTLAADGITSATVASGKSATYPLLLNSAAGMSGNATLTCKGAPANSTCVVSPGIAALGSSTLVTVTVATGVASAALRRGTGNAALRTASPFLLAGLIPFGALFLRRKRVTSLLGTLAVLCIVAGGGCGAGREIPLSGSSTPVAGAATPAGTYLITVTATSSGLTRSMNLTLTVQ